MDAQDNRPKDMYANPLAKLPRAQLGLDRSRSQVLFQSPSKVVDEGQDRRVHYLFVAGGP